LFVEFQAYFLGRNLAHMINILLAPICFLLVSRLVSNRRSSLPRNLSGQILDNEILLGLEG
jgi:hypothetical protein